MRPTWLCVSITVAMLLAVTAAPAGAQTERNIVDRPVSFSVINKNESLMRCPTDGRAYPLSGSLVAPASAMERRPRTITLLIHGAMLPGDELWRFRPGGDESYDFTLAMARLGHAVATVSLVGYGDTVGTDFPDGNLVCQGANADAVHQVVAHLKSGTYPFGAMFREWQELESREWRRAYVSPVSFPAMLERHIELVAGFDDETLRAKLRSNADLMEAYNVIAFHKAAAALGDPAPDEEVRINPYAIGLDPGRWEADGLPATTA